MRRIALVLSVLAITAVAVYWFALRGSSTTDAAAQPTHPVAQIGEGKRVLLVGADGALMGSASGKSKTRLAVLPLKGRPKADHVTGRVLEQVKVLAAAPKPLRHEVAATDYGKSGVDVEFTSGIEVRFGDAHDVARKWNAAAAVLADPSVTMLSYVDVHAPTRPEVGGEEHELPPAS